MFARKESNLNGKTIPLEWQESVIEVLQDAYSAQIKDTGRYFDVYGQIFDDEILLITSYLHETDHSLSPISVFISADLEKSSVDKTKKSFDSIVDLSGHIFDDIFATEDWSEYSAKWLETQLNGQDFFYKITRENVALSLEASKLLGE